MASRSFGPPVARRWPICGQGEGLWQGPPMLAVHPHVCHLAYIPLRTGDGAVAERLRCLMCGAVMEFCVQRRESAGG